MIRVPLKASASFLAVALFACATNPATGKRQLMLVSEGQEAEMGKEADAQFHGLYGDFPEPRVQAYVESIARPLAAASERPNLPWTFRVVDDPQVNAFALPGGYVYVTRGILTHLTSEAELAAVLGHEIGHVTARHSANAQSKQMLGMVGLGVGMLVSPALREGGGALSNALALVFLKFGRDQESQADTLGLRYILRKDYDPREMLGVFRMLDGVTTASGGDRVPDWLSTHPAPPNRLADIGQSIRRQNAKGTRVERDSFLMQLDGMVFGENPREGFFRGELFLHPEFAFQLPFPAGWSKQNEKEGVSALSPQKDAILQLSVVDDGPEAALEAFSRQQGVEPGEPYRRSSNGIRIPSVDFTVRDGDSAVRGTAGFLQHGGSTFRLLGYCTEPRFAEHRPTFDSWIRSFERLTDASVLSIQPMRVRIETLRTSSTIASLARGWRSPVSAETLALINDVRLTDDIPVGTRVKRIVGEVAR